MLGPYTLGAEEELQIVDGGTWDLTPHDYDASARRWPDEAAEVDREIHRCVLEVKTPICVDGPEVARHLARLRRRADRWAESQGQRVLAAGLHPFGDWRVQPVHQKSHYDHLMREFRDVAHGNLTYGLHLHVGLPDPVTRMPVMNLLRHDLPLLLALSVSSPFFEGRDTGLHGWRHKVFDKYPRTGIPDAWPDEASYAAHRERLVRTGCLEPGFMLWEDLRLHARYGTLEVRICDANAALWTNELLADLVQACAASADLAVRRGTAPAPWATALVEENKWRACRHGLAGSFVDWTREEELTAREAFQRLLARVSEAAEALGSLRRLEEGLMRAFFLGTSAERQRAVARGGDLRDVVRDLAAETMALGSLEADRSLAA